MEYLDKFDQKIEDMEFDGLEAYFPIREFEEKYIDKASLYITSKYAEEIDTCVFKNEVKAHLRHVIKNIIPEQINDLRKADLLVIKKNLEIIGSHSDNGFNTDYLIERINVQLKLVHGSLYKKLKSDAYKNYLNVDNLTFFKDLLKKVKRYSSLGLITEEQTITLLQKINTQIEKYNNNENTIITLTKNLDVDDEDPKKLLAERYEYSKDITSKIVTPIDTLERVNLTYLPTFTIDRNSAVAIDSAFSLEELGNGVFKLYIHYADPTNLLRANEFLIDEIIKRPRVVYLEDERFGMYPANIEKNILSLKKDSHRNANTIALTIGKDHEVLKTDVFASKICVDKKFSYNYVDRILDGDAESIMFEHDIYRLYALSLDLDHINNESPAYEIVSRISTFMNKHVAEMFEKKDLPYISYFMKDDEEPIYSMDNKGHSGLDYLYYTDMNSPIRKAVCSLMQEGLREFFIEKNTSDEAIYKQEALLRKAAVQITTVNKEIKHLVKKIENK